MLQPSLPPTCGLGALSAKPRSFRVPRRLRAPRLASAGLVVGFALSLAACAAAPTGSDVVSLQSPASSGGPSAAPSASVDPQDAMVAFAKCMRDHGVNLQVSGGSTSTSGGIVIGGDAGPGASGNAGPGAGAPQGNSGANTPEQMQAAQKACQDLMPKPVAMDPNATPDPKLMEQMLAFAKCMRGHGVNYPDPKFEGGGISISIGGDGSAIDPSSKSFQDAQKACGKDLPGGGPISVDGNGGGVVIGVGNAPSAP